MEAKQTRKFVVATFIALMVSGCESLMLEEMNQKISEQCKGIKSSVGYVTCDDNIRRQYIDARDLDLYSMVYQKRMELAKQIDKGELTKEEATLQLRPIQDNATAEQARRQEERRAKASEDLNKSMLIWSMLNQPQPQPQSQPQLIPQYPSYTCHQFGNSVRCNPW